MSSEGPPEIEQVANLAMRPSRPHLADYGATRSRHDFTQRQLLSCLVLRAYLRTTYRGAMEALAGNPRLRECLGMTEKVPQFTTLQKFSGRSQIGAITQRIIGRIGLAALQAGGTKESAAMDSTGLDFNSPAPILKPGGANGTGTMSNFRPLCFVGASFFWRWCWIGDQAMTGCKSPNSCARRRR